MITKKQFEKIKNEVEEAINQAFDELKHLSPSNYVLYLLRLEEVNGMLQIEVRTPEILDKTRMRFLTRFMNDYYAFDNGNKRVDDDEYRFNLEMMVYTHCWESDCILKQLRRLSQLLNGEEYNSTPIEIPALKKDWINENVIKLLINNRLKLGDVISENYNKELRHSFAHSSYSLEMAQKRICLQKKPTVITFDRWSKCFAYTFWLSYLLPQIIFQRTKNLTKDVNSEEFILKGKTSDGKIISFMVRYDESSGGFRCIY